MPGVLNCRTSNSLDGSPSSSNSQAPCHHEIDCSAVELVTVIEAAGKGREGSVSLSDGRDETGIRLATLPAEPLQASFGAVGFGLGSCRFMRPPGNVVGGEEPTRQRSRP